MVGVAHASFPVLEVGTALLLGTGKEEESLDSDSRKGGIKKNRGLDFLALLSGI